ncbi:MAG TPA: YcxB family protein [Armatimonadota bacterium]|jgi:hypothetical protein
MTVTYTMTQSDWWGLSRYVYTHDWQLGAFATVALLIPSVVAFTSVLSEPRPWLMATRDAVVVLLVWAPVVYALLRLKTWSVFRALPKGLRDVEISALPVGLSIITPTTEQTIKWNAITKVRRDRRAIYLFQTSRMAHIVPLRAFSSPEAARRFVDFAASHAGGAG